jgi:hypothetical protein
MKHEHNLGPVYSFIYKQNTLPNVHWYYNVMYSGHFIVLSHGEQSHTLGVFFLSVCEPL